MGAGMNQWPRRGYNFFTKFKNILPSPHILDDQSLTTVFLNPLLYLNYFMTTLPVSNILYDSSEKRHPLT